MTCVFTLSVAENDYHVNYKRKGNLHYLSNLSVQLDMQKTELLN